MLTAMYSMRFSTILVSGFCALHDQSVCTAYKPATVDNKRSLRWAAMRLAHKVFNFR